METAAVCIPFFRLFAFIGLTGFLQEIYDFCQEDIMNYVCFFSFLCIVLPFLSFFWLLCVFSFLIHLCPFQFPKLCREEVSIHVVQSREHILNTVCLGGYPFDER